MPGIGLPPLLAMVWLSLALVPMSALFSALCLALAAFARSTKEGQYYLMPLLLVTMPLAVLPMTPGVELNLGNSLIPGDRHRAVAAGDVGRQLLAGPAVRRAGGRRDAAVLSAGDPLGGRAVQLGVGAVPRERAARPGALAATPAARSAGRRPPWPRRCSAAC